MIHDGTIPVRPGETIDLNVLNEWLGQHAPETGVVREIVQFPGGFSNLTYCLVTDQKAYVLRRPPVGANIQSAHDMGREYRVLSLLKPHYDRIPTPVVYCENAEVIGGPFYIMERIKGVVLRPANAPAMHFSAAQWRGLSEALIDNLALLHSLDLEKTGLIQLGKPEGYVQRQVEGWIKRYYAAETEPIASMNRLAQWLGQNLPVSGLPAFLHNDYKFDNILFDPENLPHICGVLDWEMSTVGDPLMDLGAALAWWIEAADGATMQHYNVTWMPGNLTRREAVERYAEKSGRDMTQIRFYYVFGMFKNAVIGQQIYARWKKGLTADDRFGQLIHMIKNLARKAEITLEHGTL
jgi:aminoglycoside phosphotransferase (APT) family kinase protein